MILSHNNIPHRFLSFLSVFTTISALWHLQSLSTKSKLFTKNTIRFYFSVTVLYLHESY